MEAHQHLAALTSIQESDKNAGKRKSGNFKLDQSNNRETTFSDRFTTLWTKTII